MIFLYLPLHTKTCSEHISIPVVALSLRLRATLLIGVTRIFQQQAGFFIGIIHTTFYILPLTYIIDDLEHFQALLFKNVSSNQVTLVDSVVTMNSITLPREFNGIYFTDVFNLLFNNFIDLLSEVNSVIPDFSIIANEESQMITYKPPKHIDDIEQARGTHFSSSPQTLMDPPRRYFDQSHIGPTDIIIDEMYFFAPSFLLFSRKMIY
jgi:xanthine/uracil/vitamin C permease (AzgA family)